LLVVLGALSSCLTSGASELDGTSTIDFDAMTIGSSPAGFSGALTGPGTPGDWVVREDPTIAGGRVLAQESRDTTDDRYPLCVLDGWFARDVRVAARFRAVDGTVDRAAGLVVRYRGPGDYYLVRANALEDNVRLYRVVGGRRTQFAGADVEVSAGEWHALRLDACGGRFAVAFDGAPLFTAEDDTWIGSGRIGLWTKADSVTWFDDLERGPVPEDSPARGQE